MSIQVELAKLRTTIEQTLGPNGSVTQALGEIKVEMKDGAKVMDDHALRIDRLEQAQKTRSKFTWTLLTATCGMALTTLWNLIKK